MTAPRGTVEAAGVLNRRNTPALDGLCAIAIAVVLLAHVAVAFGATIDRIVQWYTHWGALGVRVLLVISGYVVTTALIEERSRTGSVDLKRFYLRTTRRSAPPFYFYLAVIAALAVAGLIPQSLAGVVSAATFTSNYARDAGWYADHAWLLAVEVQFYVVWPAVVRAFGARARWAAWAIVLLCPLFRWWTLTRMNGAYGFDHRFETTADLVAVGCLLSIYERPLRDHTRSFPVPPTVVVVVLAGVTVLLTGLGDHPRLDLLFGRAAIASAVAGMIFTMTHAPHSAAAVVLGWAPLAWFGRISYSLYLWQQLAFGPTGRSDALGMFVRSVIAFALALASYRLIEHPMAARREGLGASVRAMMRRVRGRRPDEVQGA